MSTEAPAGLDLSLSGPPPAPPDETLALARYPALREFRDRLGSTPLIEVPGPAGGARILAKVESANPFGSVKDRPAYALLCDAVNRHDHAARPLKLVDFSGGNLARALAGLAALTGIPVRLAVPDSIPASLLATLRAAGAELDFVPADRFLYGIMRRAADIAEQDPSWTLLHQHRNTSNPAVHEFMTGAEITEQLGASTPGHWVAAVGTGGTLTGVGRALRRRLPRIGVVGVTPLEMPYGTDRPPNGGPKFAGAGGIGYGLRQPFLDGLLPGVVHRTVSYRQALTAMGEFRALTGIAIGASSAANWLTAQEIAAGLGGDESVVTLFADAGTPEDWDRVATLRP
ncbi:pyridoxal-phosphate dependent enzyme [Kitasatospora sp. NPDC050543]|uniref:pyridoxal-phosphate dependent enzyme n=1 Tax=Kitasatospora sp. NPDC050543 TaxID=3364054 RepID=UPI0037A69C1E